MKKSFYIVKEAITRLLVRAGLDMDAAATTADCYVSADLYGVYTHGISILSTHIKRLVSGGYNKCPKIEFIKNTNAFSIMDADNAIGPVSACAAMKAAIDGAKQNGLYTVWSRNANTYGAAFYYPLMASKENLIGITFCNTPPAMAPWGGKQKILGTNPFSVAIPRGKVNPILFDMATSKVAKSKINKARIEKKQIPSDWATDENGNPTTDPVIAIRGLLLPMAEYKGYGLSLIIDVLSGLMAGAGYLDSVRSFYNNPNECMNIGQCFIALDPMQIYGECFFEEVDHYCRKIEADGAALPGQRKFLASKDGLELSDKILNDLNELLLEYEVETV